MPFGSGPPPRAAGVRMRTDGTWILKDGSKTDPSRMSAPMILSEMERLKTSREPDAARMIRMFEQTLKKRGGL